MVNLGLAFTELLLLLPFKDCPARDPLCFCSFPAQTRSHDHSASTPPCLDKYFHSYNYNVKQEPSLRLSNSYFHVKKLVEL